MPCEECRGWRVEEGKGARGVQGVVPCIAPSTPLRGASGLLLPVSRAFGARPPLLHARREEGMGKCREERRKKGKERKGERKEGKKERRKGKEKWGLVLVCFPAS